MRRSVNRILQISKKLEDKPELLHLLESGEQGWSKIAQVAYLATPETDKDLADKVNNLSKSALTAYVENIRVESVPETLNLKYSTTCPSKSPIKLRKICAS